MVSCLAMELPKSKSTLTIKRIITTLVGKSILIFRNGQRDDW